MLEYNTIDISEGLMLIKQIYQKNVIFVNMNPIFAIVFMN